MSWSPFLGRSIVAREFSIPWWVSIGELLKDFRLGSLVVWEGRWPLRPTRFLSWVWREICPLRISLLSRWSLLGRSLRMSILSRRIRSYWEVSTLRPVRSRKIKLLTLHSKVEVSRGLPISSIFLRRIFEGGLIRSELTTLHPIVILRSSYRWTFRTLSSSRKESLWRRN